MPPLAGNENDSIVRQLLRMCKALGSIPIPHTHPRLKTTQEVEVYIYSDYKMQKVYRSSRETTNNTTKMLVNILSSIC